MFLSPDKCLMLLIIMKAVANNHNAVCCDICNQWVHIGCNNVSKYQYMKLKKEKAPWFCMRCLKNEIPYSSLSDVQFERFMDGRLITSPNIPVTEQRYINVENEAYNNAIKNEYYSPEQFNDIKINAKSYNSYFHVNISSLSYHIDELHSFLSDIKIEPKIIGISECRLKTSRQALSNIELPNYSYEYTPTESSKGGTLIYIDKSLKYKSRKDLMIYKSKEQRYIITSSRTGAISAIFYSYLRTKN